MANDQSLGALMMPVVKTCCVGIRLKRLVTFVEVFLAMVTDAMAVSLTLPVCAKRLLQGEPPLEFTQLAMISASA